jgi:hypothetical protein
MKAFLNKMWQYWEAWNRVYRNQVSYGEDVLDVEFAIPIEGTELQVRYWDIRGVRQL